MQASTIDKKVSELVKQREEKARIRQEEELKASNLRYAEKQAILEPIREKQKPLYDLVRSDKHLKSLYDASDFIESHVLKLYSNSDYELHYVRHLSPSQFKQGYFEPDWGEFGEQCKYHMSQAGSFWVEEVKKKKSGFAGVMSAISESILGSERPKQFELGVWSDRVPEYFPELTKEKYEASVLETISKLGK